MASRLRCNLVSHPTSINLAIIPTLIRSTNYNAGLPAEFAKYFQNFANSKF